MRAFILRVGGAAALTLAGSSWPALAASAGPSCGPAQEDVSALLGGAVTVSPMPGSRDATPQTQVSFRGVPAGEISVASVVGSRTGRHRGRLLAYSQGDGASFLPVSPFAEGERVTVHATVHRHGVIRRLTDVFAVAGSDPLTNTPEAIHRGSAAQIQSFHSRPDLHPPVVSLMVDRPTPDDGDEFLAPYSGPGQAGPMILDPSGQVVWFKPLPEHVSASDFRVQEYDGSPVLTWWEGDISVHGFGVGDDVIVDRSYRKVASVHAGNGLAADLHEFLLSPNGTALITAYHPLLCDVSSVHGPSDGAVTDGVVQEIDVRTGLVRWQWTSLDHVPLGDSYGHPGRSRGWPFDYFHVNSIEREGDGELLISARNTWTVYDVDGRSGRIAWRLGGRRSSFAEPGAARTAWQHDPRELPDGSISVFDNGSAPTVHHQSRGVVLRLDRTAKRATLAAELVHGPPLIAQSQGNLQALPGGGWFVGWGQVPELSEFSPAGQLLFDARLPDHDQSYRSFRFPWSGAPFHRPTLAVAAGASGLSAFASWNGATAVASWRVLAGGSPETLQPVATVPKSGFETGIALAAGGGEILAVQALDASGGVLGQSAAVRAG